MTALNRWTAQKRDLEKANNMGKKGVYMGGALLPSPEYGPYASMKRPKIASEVTTVKDCEHWRTELVRGVAKKIAEIQNATLGEHRIRDLNDEINKDLREKKYWDEQIKALGGPDYAAMAANTEVAYGAELASHSGYKYFGAAKDLPGVRELFESEVVPEAPRKSRKQLFMGIQPDYYGWRDEEDEMLLLAEQGLEHEQMQKSVARWKSEQANKKPKTQAEAPAPELAEQGTAAAGAATAGPGDAKKSETGADFKAYVDVPTMEDIERLIVQKKKQHLLARYASSEQKQQSSETSELLSSDA